MDKNFKDIYSDIHSEIKNSIPPAEYAIWIQDLEYSHEKENVVYLKTSTSFKKERIKRNYLQELQNIFSKYKKNIKIQIDSKDDTTVFIHDKPDKLSSSPISTSTSQIPTHLESKKNALSFHHKTEPALDNNYTFSRFLVTKSNQIAYDHCQKITKSIGSITPLYLYGTVGVGKTHLLQSVGNHYKETYPFLKIKCLNPNDFVGEYTRSLETQTDRQFRIKYQSLDVLLIDDIQFFIGKKQSCIEFFHIFNSIQKKQMVFCSDREPSELKKLDERLKSRLSSSAIIEIEKPNEEDKENIIYFYAEQNKLSLTKEVIRFLAKYLPSDIRKIIGAINSLTTFQELYNKNSAKNITTAFCKSYIKQLSMTRDNFSPENLIVSISNYSKIPINTIRAKNRSKTVVYYRNIALYLLREYTNLSITEIGNYLGGRTASTVCVVYTKIKDQLKTDLILKNDIKNILIEA